MVWAKQKIPARVCWFAGWLVTANASISHVSLSLFLRTLATEWEALKASVASRYREILLGAIAKGHTDLSEKVGSLQVLLKHHPTELTLTQPRQFKR